MYIPLLKSHSGLRWLLLASFVLTLVYLFKMSVAAGNPKKIKLLALTTLIISHIQILLGLTLYFISPKVVFAAGAMKDSVQRFFLVEHISLMLIAVILITIGYARWKRTNRLEATRKLFWYYFISFLLILLSIPWPFRIAGSSWF